MMTKITYSTCFYLTLIFILASCGIQTRVQTRGDIGQAISQVRLFIELEPKSFLGSYRGKYQHLEVTFLSQTKLIARYVNQPQGFDQIMEDGYRYNQQVFILFPERSYEIKPKNLEEGALGIEIPLENIRKIGSWEKRASQGKMTKNSYSSRKIERFIQVHQVHAIDRSSSVHVFSCDSLANDSIYLRFHGKISPSNYSVTNYKTEASPKYKHTIFIDLDTIPEISGKRLPLPLTKINSTYTPDQVNFNRLLARGFRNFMLIYTGLASGLFVYDEFWG